MSTIVKNPSAASRYRASASVVNQHRELVGSDAFERACDFALLNYSQRVMTDARPDGNGAASGFYRLLGAHEFLRELRMLAESPTQTSSKVDQDNLM